MAKINFSTLTQVLENTETQTWLTVIKVYTTPLVFWQ